MFQNVKHHVVEMQMKPSWTPFIVTGNHPAKGLWGMKHTRKPVDNMVLKAKTSSQPLPMVRLQIGRDGINFIEINDTKSIVETNNFTVDIISYGVQDLVYTKVFSMIVVLDEYLQTGVPFECHSFVCDSRDQARKLTYCLAAAFQDYGRRVKFEGHVERPIKKFAIDLRTPEEQINASDNETDA